MRLLLLLLCISHYGTTAPSNCHWCDSQEGRPESDPGCGNDEYVGFDQMGDFGACTTLIYDSGRVVRRGSYNSHADGECHDYDAYRTCHCLDNLCNNHLCQACVDRTTEELTAPTLGPTTTHVSNDSLICHWCDTMEGWPESDPACGSDGYVGFTKTDESWAACAIYIYNNGRVYRSGSKNDHEDGECDNYSTYKRCHCLDDLCNDRLCQTACDGIVTEDLNTEEPTTTADPGTNLTCHWCDTNEGWPESDPECGNDGYVGFTKTDDAWVACAIYIHDNGRVYRTGSKNEHEDGECDDYGSYKRCHCLDDLCNDRLCQTACDGIVTEELTTPEPTTTVDPGTNLTCHWCDTNEGWPESDPECGNDGYVGFTKTDDDWVACAIYIYDNGRIYRTGSKNEHEDGECDDYGSYKRCHCLDELCNDRLCQTACDGIVTEELTTPEPTTTVDPGLTCYSCDTEPGFPESDPDCRLDGYDGLTETRDTWNSCIIYKYDNGRVWRTGKTGIHEDGECEDKGTYDVCYCTTDACNNGLCQEC